MIQATFERFKKICPIENIFVVTNQKYVPLVNEQLPLVISENIISEPSRRNTAPCIAYANLKIEKRNPEATIVVAASDHLILNEDIFAETVTKALNHAAKHKTLLTLGIKPSRPDTGYGYIQFEEGRPNKDDQIRKVKTFTEKPDTELARQFLDSGDFFWNSGIFIWHLSSIKEAFELHLPEMAEIFESALPQIDTTEEKKQMSEIYSMCENISVDYGIMEKAKNVEVVLSNFGWSDLGTWGSLYTHLPKDREGNAAVGKTPAFFNAHNNMVHSQTTEKLVVLYGLDDVIVVDTADVLLICKKDDEQKIKEVVNDLRINKHITFI